MLLRVFVCVSDQIIQENIYVYKLIDNIFLIKK